MSDSEQCSNRLGLNFFGQLFMWIGADNDHIWLSMGYMSDSVRTNSNFLCELRQIMTRYDFILSRRMILSNVRTDSQLNLILLVNVSCELGQIMTRYDLLLARARDSEQCSNRLQLELILILVNFIWIGANGCIFWERSPKWGYKFN